MFHKRLLKEFSDNRKYVAGMVIMQWAALLANVALMYVLAAYVGRISGIVKGESLTASPSDGVLLIVFAAALFVRIAATSAANRMSYLASTQVKRRLRDRIYESAVCSCGISLGLVLFLALGGEQDDRHTDFLFIFCKN